MKTERLRLERIQRLKQLNDKWKERAEPVLTRILTENPSALEQVEYSVPSKLPVVGGSFYNPETYELKVRKEGEVYFIDRLAMGILDRKGKHAYALHEVAADFSRGLLRYWCNLYDKTTEFSDKRIPKTGRFYLIKEIKRLTGKDLRKEAGERT